MTAPPPLWGDVARDALADVHAVIVLTGAGDRRRRRLYLSLDSAEKAARRARDRGDRAAVVLVALQPVELEDATA